MKRSTRKLYNLVIGIILIALAGAMVWLVEPKWWSEILMLVLTWLGNLLVWRWTTGKKKWGWILASGIVGVVVLNRFGWLNGITLGLVLVGLGLISLIN